MSRDTYPQIYSGPNHMKLKMMGKTKPQGDFIHPAYKYSYRAVRFQVYSLGDREWYFCFSWTDQSGESNPDRVVRVKTKYLMLRDKGMRSRKKDAIKTAMEAIDAFIHMFQKDVIDVDKFEFKYREEDKSYYKQLSTCCC